MSRSTGETAERRKQDSVVLQSREQGGDLTVTNLELWRGKGIVKW